MSEKGSDRGFKVEDKRRFDAEGQPREDEGNEEAAPAQTSAAQADQHSEPTGTESQGRAGEAELSFSSFVVGLASQAFMFLGATPDPSTGVVHKDLPQAAAMIDILSILQEKTSGNLSDDEAHLMEEVLYELRMRYVSETQHGGAGQASGQGETHEG